MVRADIIAQASGAPNNGASNATDFQPPTRNPQQDRVNTQQQSGTVQATGDPQILNNPNTHIEVPVDPAEATFTSLAPARGINWPVVLIATLVIVVIAELIIQKREKKRATPAPTLVNPEVAPADTTEPQTQPKTSTHKPKKKKAKSKRKKK